MTGGSAPSSTGPRRNRVDPWGDLHAESARGLFTGNRGCVVDDREQVVRHHGSSLWITCVLEFRDRRWPPARSRRWTPLFFLDDAVALAAGHRPCAACRRGAYLAYRDAVTTAVGAGEPLRAADLDRRLRAERLRRGRGLSRAGDRITWPAPYRELPDGWSSWIPTACPACWSVTSCCGSPSTAGPTRGPGRCGGLRRC